MDKDFWDGFYHQYKLRPAEEWQLALGILGFAEPYLSKDFLSMIHGDTIVQVDLNGFGLGESMAVDDPYGNILYESPGRWA